MSAVQIEIDGLQVQATEGETLLSAAQRHGHAIPHLCHMDGLTPAGNCRACVVEIEGERALAASCCRTVKAGQKVHLQTARVQRSQKMVLELLLANQPQTPHTRSSELTQWCEALSVTGSRFAARPQPAPDRSHPAISVHLDACIQCMRCVRA